MAMRWTEHERRAWVAFIQGGVLLPPGARTLAAVVERLRGYPAKGSDPGESYLLPSYTDLSTSTLHLASMAAMNALRDLPHRRANQLKDYVDVVVRFAAGDIGPFVDGQGSELETLKSIPDHRAHHAVLVTRAAITEAIAAESASLKRTAA